MLYVSTLINQRPSLFFFHIVTHLPGSDTGLPSSPDILATYLFAGRYRAAGCSAITRPGDDFRPEADLCRACSAASHRGS